MYLILFCMVTDC